MLTQRRFLPSVRFSYAMSSFDVYFSVNNDNLYKSVDYIRKLGQNSVPTKAGPTKPERTKPETVI